MKLTADILDTLTCKGKTETTYFDDSLPGFGLRCRASGVRRWVIQYESPTGGGTKRITIGGVDVFGLDQARKIARRLLAEKALGNDPALRKIEARKAAKHTLGSVIESYLEHSETRLRPSTMRHLNRYLRDWWRPLANVPISKLTRRDIAPYLTGPSVAAARARSRLMNCALTARSCRKTRRLCGRCIIRPYGISQCGPFRIQRAHSPTKTQTSNSPTTCHPESVEGRLKRLQAGRILLDRLSLATQSSTFFAG